LTTFHQIAHRFKLKKKINKFMARSGTGIRDCGGRIMGIGGLISPNPHNPSTTIPNPGYNFI
jgi:hypothetical protein